LGRLGQPSAQGVLHEISKEKNPRTKSAALAALNALKNSATQ
jgi:hypothetical protein